MARKQNMFYVLEPMLKTNHNSFPVKIISRPEDEEIKLSSSALHDPLGLGYCRIHGGYYTKQPAEFKAIEILKEHIEKGNGYNDDQKCALVKMEKAYNKKYGNK